MESLANQSCCGQPQPPTFFCFCRSVEIMVPSENDYTTGSHLSFEDSPGLLFRWEQGTLLAKSKCVEEVRAVLSAANLPAHQHSFWRGGGEETTAVMPGIQDSIIQTLERWKKLSLSALHQATSTQTSSGLYHSLEARNITSSLLLHG